MNLAGAYIVCATVLAVALYLTTAFSFASLRVWAPTRFAFAIALWNRYKDWQDSRAKKKMQKELEKRRATRPTVTAQLVPARPAASQPSFNAPEPVRATGIDRMTSGNRDRDEEERVEPPLRSAAPEAIIPDVEVTERADTGAKPKTTLAENRSWRLQAAAKQSAASP